MLRPVARLTGILVAITGLLVLYSAWGAWMVERAYPPAVLLHGASTTLRDFTTSLAPPLTLAHRVLAFGRPGYGYSERAESPVPSLVKN